MIAGILFSCSLLMLLSGDPAQSTNVISTVKARVNLSGSTNVKGMIDLTETSNRIGVHFVGKVTGLSPGKHGVHVHQFGDVISQGCDSTGAHYNPIGVSHGRRESDRKHRHMGDEGNIVADAHGVANVDFVDRLVSLLPNRRNRDTSIVGRGLVVHASEDDLGLGGNNASLATGNSGGRVACGVVELVFEDLEPNKKGGRYEDKTRPPYSRRQTY